MSGSGHLLPPSNVFVVKDDDGAHVHAPLPARIARVFYINAYGLETFPKPNTRFVDALSESRTYVSFCLPQLCDKTAETARVSLRAGSCTRAAHSSPVSSRASPCAGSARPWRPRPD